ncbi:DUF3332 domain-containing protein [Shewanella sp. NIFS-20-20]|uniref:DUF3332 domain-containing protein n=1 Tax=Shewanella sp. NIFS-20-20 TaxID=2853806 RepID=UPI001C47AC1E|nr:DUF3332 domain-containing protein [Shewanella sp. NIFS-20-20]MBV7314164.1 DUF3332 domain-containing protein [Shewanella sp. NIFS-20-20]
MTLTKKLAIGASLLICTQLTGCMGSMGLSGLVTKGNLSVVDNRYGRAGLFVLLSPVYGFAATGDLFIFNTIEFWTGTNPITGKSPALVDMPVEAIFKVNSHLDKDLTKAPLTGVKLTKATVTPVSDNKIDMLLTYEDGSEQIMSGEKIGDNVDFYLDGEHIATASAAELQAYYASRQS